MKHKWFLSWRLSSLAITVGGFQLRAHPITIDWYKIAGGSAVSTNSQYGVSGTIGQSDAGPEMRGGRFSATGGFWTIYLVQTPGAPLLTITYQDGQAVVSWPVETTGWALQTNSNLSIANWGNYQGTILNNSVTNAPIQGYLFYRLIQP
jgi:hypothetical protein